MTTRRTFIKNASLAAGGFLLGGCLSGRREGLEYVVGHGKYRYRINKKWGELDRSRFFIKDAHEMVQDKQGRFLLLTNDTRNNILIYGPGGNLIDSWGTTFPGGHGLTLNEEGEEEFLYICDYERHQVVKTTLEGKELLTLSYPKEAGKQYYTEAKQYKPTETAIAPNGDIYVVDGYGRQNVIVYDAQGKFKFIFGGLTSFFNAHGICLDNRNPDQPELLISGRAKNCLFRYTLEGKSVGEIPLHGAFINRAVIKGNQVYLSVLKSASDESGTSGFVMILDKHNQVISCPGGSDPETPRKIGFHQTSNLFQHPHDVCVDKDENLYIPQWNSGGISPIQLIRV